jgi:hypothetical protein
MAAVVRGRTARHPSYISTERCVFFVADIAAQLETQRPRRR